MPIVEEIIQFPHPSVTPLLFSPNVMLSTMVCKHILHTHRACPSGSADCCVGIDHVEIETVGSMYVFVLAYSSSSSTCHTVVDAV